MQAQEILIHAKKNVFTNNSGNNLSMLRGDGLDFYEIRNYHLDDDVRKINHKASAKTGELKINIFNENRQLNIVIAIIVSSSLYFGSTKLKCELIAEIMAMIGYSSLKQHNQTKVIFFIGNQQIVMKIKNDGDLLVAINTILEMNLLKIKTDFKDVCDYINKVHKKALIFMLSDFYGHHDFSSIAHQNQINALIVRDNVEEFPNFGNELSLVSALDNSSYEVIIDKKLAKKYAKLLKKQDSKLTQHLSSYKINFGKILSNDDVFMTLSQILKN